jgi:hypothetical protein
MQTYLFTLFALIALFGGIHRSVLEHIPEKAVPRGMLNELRFSEALPRWALIHLALFASIAGYKFGSAKVLYLSISGMALGVLIAYVMLHVTPKQAARVFQLGWVALPLLSLMLWPILLLGSS